MIIKVAKQSSSYDHSFSDYFKLRRDFSLLLFNDPHDNWDCLDCCCQALWSPGIVTQGLPVFNHFTDPNSNK